jgi:hypothetical protein
VTQRSTCLACGTPLETVPAASPAAVEPKHSFRNEEVDDKVTVFVGLAGSLTALFGAFMTWLGPISAFHIPLHFLLDSHATSGNPKVGHFLIVVALCGILLSFARGAERARIATGCVLFATTILYLAQVSSLAHGVRVIFDEAVGWGPWFTVAGAIALAASGLRANWLGTRWVTAGAISAVLLVGTWGLVTYGFNHKSIPHIAAAGTMPSPKTSAPLQNPAACTLVPQSAAAALFERTASPALTPAVFPGEFSHCGWVSYYGPSGYISRHVDVGLFSSTGRWYDPYASKNVETLAGVGDRSALTWIAPNQLQLQFVAHRKLVVLQYDVEGEASVRTDHQRQRTELIAFAKRIAPAV